MTVRLLLVLPLLLFVSALFSLGAASPAWAQYPGFGDPGVRSSSSGGADGLVPVQDNVDGGTVPIGATAQVVVRFRNSGAQPIQTGLIRLYPSSTVSAVVSLNQCEEGSLPPDAECAVALSVKGLQSGNWRVEMLMSHSGRSRLVAATVSGQVEAGSDTADTLTSDVESIPAELDFGDLNDSQTLVEPIILRNVSTTPITLNEIYIDSSKQAGYGLKTECKELGAGQACIAIVSWSPKLKGRSSGVLVVKHSGPAGLTSVPLSGEYSPSDVDQAQVFPQAVPGKGLMVSSQTEVDFGEGVETASTFTVSLVNVGDSDLKISDIKISGQDNGLGVKEGGCEKGSILEPVDACPLTIKWSPTRIGNLLDDIQILHDGVRGVLVLPVRGEATSTVSQDQKAIVLGNGAIVRSVSQSGSSSDVTPASMTQRDVENAIGGDVPPPSPPSMPTASYLGIANPASVLDGYKITSFSPDRAIINGPGGSRIVFDGEDVVLGGLPWFVMIQKNGIEFAHQGQRVLLLFDRSLSTINRVSTSSSGSSVSSSDDE